jgi:hypothetical protein
VHLVNNLASGNNGYSWRSMLALETVAAMEPDKFWGFYESLWQVQPAGHSPERDDLTDEQIARVAQSAGVRQDVIDRFVESPVAQWAAWSSAEGMKILDGLQQGTPAILLSFNDSEPVLWEEWLLSGRDANGEEVQIAGDLAKAINLVKAGLSPNELTQQQD